MGNNNQKKKSESYRILSGQKIKDTKNNIFVDDSSKTIAFYLPQFHRIPENSEWWGEGFTEWNNAVKGKSNFSDHYQPHLPRELGFYNLENIAIMEEQVEMAKLYGLKGFCFYYYWFSGRKILEGPINRFLKSNINFDFCLCWANENWTRRWDGEDQKVLLKQEYAKEDPVNFINSLLPFFKDKRYIRLNDKPIIIVYRAKDIPDVINVFEIWRRTAKKNGFTDIHIIAVDFYDISHPGEVNADALVEFPPHKFNGISNSVDQVPQLINKDWKGSLVDFRKVIKQSLNKKAPNFKLYRGIMPSWDNTARRQDSSTIIYKSNPDLFEIWTRYIRSYTYCNFTEEERFIFINSWNEWGEGCHLEPDQKYGLQYLEAFLKSASSSISFNLVDEMKIYNLDLIKRNMLITNMKRGINKSQRIIDINLKSNALTFRINIKYMKERCAKRLFKVQFLYKLFKGVYLIIKIPTKYIFKFFK